MDYGKSGKAKTKRKEPRDITRDAQSVGKASAGPKRSGAAPDKAALLARMKAAAEANKPS